MTDGVTKRSILRLQILPLRVCERPVSQWQS
jgi:hypothetical protein